jgi:pimeloyl-ACP methyl ester carboxylesterase
MTAATFLLVHGAFHGGWCWQRVVPLLAARGHAVEALDLPYPDDPGTDAATLLEMWAAHVAARACAHAGRVILVGHSRGGLVISQAAERVPGKIGMLVYCAAMLVGGGETMADTRQRLDEPANPALRFERAADGISLVADPHSVAAVIYSGCSADDAAWASRQLRPEPPAGFGIAPRLTPGRYGSVPRAAIECNHDAVMSAALQHGMRVGQPCEVVISLDCDHAPQVSDPAGLCAALDRIANLVPQ